MEEGRLKRVGISKQYCKHWFPFEILKHKHYNELKTNCFLSSRPTSITFLGGGSIQGLNVSLWTLTEFNEVFLGPKLLVFMKFHLVSFRLWPKSFASHKYRSYLLWSWLFLGVAQGSNTRLITLRLRVQIIPLATERKKMSKTFYFELIKLVSICREVFLRWKAQYSWHPCIN